MNGKFDKCDELEKYIGGLKKGEYYESGLLAKLLAEAIIEVRRNFENHYHDTINSGNSDRVLFSKRRSVTEK